MASTSSNIPTVGGNRPPKMPKFNTSWIYIVILVTLAVVYFMGDGQKIGQAPARTASYSSFKTYVDRGYATRIVVNKTESKLRMYVKGENVRDVFHMSLKQTGPNPYLDVMYGSVDQVEQFIDAERAEGKFKGELTYEISTRNGILDFIISLAPVAFFIFLWFFVMNRMSGGTGGGMGIFNVGRSKAQMFEKGNTLGITFKDVAGQEGAKQEVQEIVDFLKNPQKYTDLGGKIPKGALLVGPPGTGKTLLAKAVAGEAGVPFYSMSGSDFVEMFVGVGASRVRDTFAKAKEKSPSIIFIDEIDAIGRARSKNPGMGGNDERENTLNALLTEMDGFGTNSGVIILAATNRVDMLDRHSCVQDVLTDRYMLTCLTCLSVRPSLVFTLSL